MERSGRAKSPASSSDKRDTLARTRRSGHRSTDYGDHHSHQSNGSNRGSKDFEFNCECDTYESPTESLTSSLSSSFQIDRSTVIADKSSHSADKSWHSADKSTDSKREKDHVKEGIRRSGTTRKTRAAGVLPSDGGTMIEIGKITALVEEELLMQRDKHREQLNRSLAKYKERRERFMEENNQLRDERDEARRELEKCKRSYASQKRAAERNDRLQSQQKNRIESLEEQRELCEELQSERDALLDEVTRAQQQQQQTKAELSALKVKVREDSQKRLSVMESLSITWDTEQKEAKQKEALLNSELDIMSKTLKAEQEFLKSRNQEFDQLEALYRSAKKDLRSIKMTMIAKKEEMDEEIIAVKDSQKRLAEEHKQTLKLKSEEIFMAETTIRNLKAELKSTKEKMNLKEKSTTALIEELKKSKGKSDAVDPEVKAIREENSRLKSEVKELQRQVESYLANMALQQEFCDSLKSRIYKEQENEQQQVEEIHKLRKRIKKQQKEVAVKDLQINQLKQLLGDVESGSSKTKAKSGSEATAPKKSSLKKANGARKGYRSS